MCNDLQKNLPALKKKKKLKNQDIKQYLTQRIIQKIFKNQKIHCLEIIETKQNVYDHTIEKYKRMMGYNKKKLSTVLIIEICQTILDIAKK